MNRRLYAQVKTLTATIGVLFSTLPSLAQTQQPLTDQAGDPKQGRLVFLDKNKGHCLLCHRLSTVTAAFQGTIGPPLDGIGQRLAAADIRARIIDPTRFNPNTVMPAYHRVKNLRQVAVAYRGKPMLSKQEVEDLVAFMQTQQIPTPKVNEPTPP